MGTQLGVAGPLIEHANEAPVELWDTLRCCPGDPTAFLLDVFIKTQNQGVYFVYA